MQDVEGCKSERSIKGRMDLFPQNPLDGSLRDAELVLKFDELDEIVNQRSEGFLVQHDHIEMLTAQGYAVLVSLAVLLVQTVLDDEQNFRSGVNAAAGPLAAEVIALENVGAKQLVLVRTI